MRVRNMAVPIFAAALVSCAGGTWMDDAPLTPAASTIGRVVAAAGTQPAAGHVFVVDGGGGAPNGTLFRFPIQNGVVASQPDNTLSIPPTSSSVAVAGDGTQYVLVKAPAPAVGGRVLVFAPGATGNDKPIRKMRFESGLLQDVAVDAGGYLYVAQATPYSQLNGARDVAIVAPDGHVVNRLTWTLYSSAQNVALDPQGNLYVRWDDAGVAPFNYVVSYATPETNPNYGRDWCNGRRQTAYGDIALSHDHLFVGKRKREIGGTSQVGFIVRFDPATPNAKPAHIGCPAQEGGFLIRVQTSPPLGGTFAIEAAGGHIFTLDEGPSFNTPRLLELDGRGALEVPIADVRYSQFRYPTEIATGP